jgi:ubiquitin-like 1-activating enzyme E1 A
LLSLESCDFSLQRAESSIANLRQLNPNVTITANTASLASLLASNPAYFTQFRAICMVSQPLALQIEVNTLLRTQAAARSAATASSAAASPPAPAFFTGECFGLYAYFFEDLQSHTYTHTKVKKDERGNEEEVIATDTRIYQRTLEGLFGADTKYPQLAKAFGKKRQEKSALEAWLTMRTILTWRQQQLEHHAAHASSTSFPSITDATAVVALNLQRDSLASSIDLPARIVSPESLVRVARMVGCELAAVCAVVGGILGQEILKVLSGKDEPLNNTFVYSAEEGYGIMKEL